MYFRFVGHKFLCDVWDLLIMLLKKLYLSYFCLIGLSVWGRVLTTTIHYICVHYIYFSYILSDFALFLKHLISSFGDIYL